MDQSTTTIIMLPGFNRPAGHTIRQRSATQPAGRATASGRPGRSQGGREHGATLATRTNKQEGYCTLQSCRAAALTLTTVVTSDNYIYRTYTVYIPGTMNCTNHDIIIWYGIMI